MLALGLAPGINLNNHLDLPSTTVCINGHNFNSLHLQTSLYTSESKLCNLIMN